MPLTGETTTNGGQKLEYLVDGEDFYRFVGSHIKHDPGLNREAAYFNLDFIFTVGAEEFYTYYVVNNSNSTVSNSIPDYTNLSEGAGIFSSRSVKTYPGKLLNDLSLDSLINGQFTVGLFH